MALDLDAARAARAEKDRRPRVIKLGGEEFTVPARCPIDALEEVAEGNLRECLRLLLGDEQYARFMAHRPDDLDFRAIGEMYGVSFPESSASAPSSGDDGTSSRPTSSESTEPTSPTPAGAPITSELESSYR